MKELWKEIPRYPHCEVSNEGRVRYKETTKIHGLAHHMRPLKLTGFGYLQLTIDNKTESAHNLVAEAFIGPRPMKDYQVDHIDNNKLNNRPENLRWISHSQNTMRASTTGKRRYFYEGELWLMKKLISARVAYITISKMFKCSTTIIQDVKKGRKDSHLKYNT